MRVLDPSAATLAREARAARSLHCKFQRHLRFVFVFAFVVFNPFAWRERPFDVQAIVAETVLKSARSSFTPFRASNAIARLRLP